MQFGKNTIGVFFPEIVFEIEISPDCIEAVYLVKDIEFTNVFIGAKAKIVGISSGARGI